MSTYLAFWNENLSILGKKFKSFQSIVRLLIEMPEPCAYDELPRLWILNITIEGAEHGY
jgi:hypothetical protein